MRPDRKPAPARAPSPSKERLRLWLKLLKASRMIEADLRERLRIGFDSTLPRFDVMAALHRMPEGLRMSELSTELKVSNGNVTGIVDRLVDEGMIVRVPVDNDRRATVVRLTHRGIESFDAMAREHEAWVDEMLSAIDPAEAAALGATLDHISTHAATRMEVARKAGKDE